MTFEESFKLSMKRDLPQLLEQPGGLSIGLGESGQHKAGRDMSFGPPQWIFSRDAIPIKSGSVGIVHAYHFLEHLDLDDVIELLREVERVLMPGGVFQFAIPHFSAEISSDDITHKSFWTENVFRNLFRNDHYSPTAQGWKLKEHYIVAAAVAARNLSIMGQLVKVKA